MTIVTGIYPKTETSRFDYDYYLDTHIPRLKELLFPSGLKELRLLRGAGSLASDDVPAFELIIELRFSSIDEARKAAADHAGEILGDIPNFTDVHPIIQLNDELLFAAAATTA